MKRLSPLSFRPHQMRTQEYMQFLDKFCNTHKVMWDTQEEADHFIASE